jgi:hypothetical protein
MSKSLHTLGLIACGLKILAGIFYYTGVDIVKESCVTAAGQNHAKCKNPDETLWNRPYFSGALLFAGMSFTLIPFFIYRNGKPGVPKPSVKVFVNMLIPSMLEFAGQVLFLMGNKNLTTALSMTLKGSRVVFSAIFLVIFLKRKLFPFHWAAAAAVMVGLAVASIPSLIDTDSAKKPGKTTKEILIGIAMVLAGEMLRSLKGVYEERLLKKLHYDALMVVGLQGLLGFILSVAALFVVDAIQIGGKPLESLRDSFSQFASAPLVWGISTSLPLTVPALFVMGAYVTKLMSAVHNALTGTITTAIVWIISIIIHFIDSNRGVKLKWILLVQLLGFIIVVLSSMVYDSMLRLPFFAYPADRAEASGAGSTAKTHPSDPDLVVDQETVDIAEAIGFKESDIVDESDEEQTTLVGDEPARFIETVSPSVRKRS